MPNLPFRIALFLAFMVFAILLNSTGTVVLQSIEQFRVSKESAALLEGFKDIPILIGSFLLASFLPWFGYRRAIAFGALSVSVVCALMPLLNGFWAFKLLFFCVGIAFGAVKIAIYSSVGLLTRGPKHHASFLNILEGAFMLAVLAGFWLFSFFIDSAGPGTSAWLNVYWVLSGLALLAAVIAFTSHADESAIEKGMDAKWSLAELWGMLGLIKHALILVFSVSAFFYVLIEQGINAWLPTFNREVLGLTAVMSIQMTSILPACIAIGRLSAGVLLRKIHWQWLIGASLLLMALVILISLPLGHLARGEALVHISPTAYIFPLIGLFMGPIYPTLNSVVLSTLPLSRHAPATGLMVIFSALGGTTGAVVVGSVFGHHGGIPAIYLILLPILILALLIFPLRRLSAAPSRPLGAV